MEKKALIAIAFIITVAFLINNAPKKPTQQKKLRAQITETFNFSDTDINNPANYDYPFNTSNNAPNEPNIPSQGFIQQLKKAIRNLPVPRFVGPSTFKETEFDPCATNKKSPIKPRLPFSPSAWNR